MQAVCIGLDLEAVLLRTFFVGRGICEAGLESIVEVGLDWIVIGKLNSFVEGWEIDLVASS